MQGTERPCWQTCFPWQLVMDAGPVVGKGLRASRTPGQPSNIPMSRAWRRAGTGQMDRHWADSVGLLEQFSKNVLVGLSKREVLRGALRFR